VAVAAGSNCCSSMKLPDALTACTDIDCRMSAQRDNFEVLVEVEVAGKPSSGMEGQMTGHDETCAIGERPRTEQFGSCCCRNHPKNRILVVDRMETLGAPANRYSHGCRVCSRETVS
jgi:hypothetical protein